MITQVYSSLSHLSGIFSTDVMLKIIFIKHAAMHQYAHLKKASHQLYLALTLGYIEDFQITSDGLLFCRAYPMLRFDMHEVHLTPIDCPGQKATLYLITTKRIVLKGTLIEYHEV